MKKCPFFNLRLVSVFVLSVMLIESLLLHQNVNGNEPNSMVSEQPPEKPMIIWFHNGGFSSISSLKTAISSGLISHVLILYKHRNDGDWQSNSDVLHAIKIVKESDTKLIWCRDLWPWYKLGTTGPKDLFDSLYYIREIKYLRDEGTEMGADLLAFDIEPYANSPMKLYLKSKNRVRLSKEKLSQLRLMIKKVILTSGKVDLVLPAASISLDHPYNILSELGKLRVSEHTYYDNEKTIRNLKYPYEIFGAYLSPHKRNEKSPLSPYFLANEIFDKSYLWSERKGVFIYTSPKNSLAVAKAMTLYARTLPILKVSGPNEANNP